MKPLKLFLAGAFLFSLTSVTFGQQPENDSQVQADRLRQNPPQNSSSISKPPTRVRALFKNNAGTVTVTFLLLPGQTLKLYDPYYDFVKMTSDFPVALHGANCNSDGPTDFDCRNIPSDRYLIIDDSRIGISPDSSPANRVKFVAVHHRATD